jgi:serine/threonine-protein kinase
MATINHPGVVDVYDYGSDQQIAFLVMEYVEGDALSRTLSRVGRLTPARTMALVAQAADALQAAHEKGIVHRDVKPGNLLVRPNGTLVLTDFGIARSAMVGQLTAAGSVLGTASYISPEQAAGGTATAASDIYALGVVAYQCLSGHRPFEGDNPLEIAMKHVREQARPLPGDIPPAIRRIVDQSMAKDPAARFQTAALLGAVARQAAATLGNAPASRPASQPARPASPAPTSSPGPANTPTPPRTAPSYPPAPASPVAAPPAPVSQQPYRPAPQAPGGYRPGAASIPPGRPVVPTSGQPARPGQPYGYPPAQPEDSSTNRQILIVLAVVLGVLVLLCAGLISYLVGQQGSKNNSSSVPTGLQMWVRQDAPLERPVPSGEAGFVTRPGDAQTSEGRQTR